MADSETRCAPVDRQDIYDLSRLIDYVIIFVKETAIEIYTSGIGADKTICAMAEALFRNTTFTVKGVKSMKTRKDKFEDFIRMAGEANHEIEILYVFCEG